MKEALVGYTGFVGSNLAAAHTFMEQYNSKNIAQSYGTRPDLLVYAGVRAEKFLANRDPEEDFKTVQEAFANIQRIQPHRLVLISTVDVYRSPVGVDENTPIETEGLHAYGANRYQLEQWVREEYPQALIVRLPGLYGKNIKKNFIYDFIHVIPAMLKEEKFRELETADKALAPFYQRQDNGFYKCRPLAREEEAFLQKYFRKTGFTALNFTDSRSVFQFYPLSMLWGHVKQALEQELRLLNLATEPIGVGELYERLTGKAFVNHTAQTPAFYDFRSIYAKGLGRSKGYLLEKNFLLEDLRRFVGEMQVST